MFVQWKRRSQQLSFSTCFYRKMGTWQSSVNSTFIYDIDSITIHRWCKYLLMLRRGGCSRLFLLLCRVFLQGLTAGMPSGDYGELGGNLPFVSTLNSSYSTSMSLPSPYLLVPPAARKTISDVRRTFCLFVTFDLLFISLLWIIELNVSFRLRICFFCWSWHRLIVVPFFFTRSPNLWRRVCTMKWSCITTGRPSLTSL